MDDKRTNVLALAQSGAYAMRIIKRATEPGGDADYVRRLRLWAADCAARTLPLITGDPRAYADALAAVEAARAFARGEIGVAALEPFRCDPNSKYYLDCERTAYSVRAEVSLCAALTAQEDIYFGARNAAEHAREAVTNAAMLASRYSPEPVRNAHADELQWQLERLVLWLDRVEPEEWPVLISPDRIGAVTAAVY